MQLLAPGFGLAQPQLLQALGERSSTWLISLFLPPPRPLLGSAEPEQGVWGRAGKGGCPAHTAMHGATSHDVVGASPAEPAGLGPAALRSRRSKKPAGSSWSQ